MECGGLLWRVEFYCGVQMSILACGGLLWRVGSAVAC